MALQTSCLPETSVWQSRTGRDASVEPGQPQGAHGDQCTEVTNSDLQRAQRQMFIHFCALMDREDIAYVILSAYQGYPDRIDSDVDFMVSAADFARLPGVLGRPGCIPGAQLLQRLQHETTACYYVFATQVGARLAYLRPDADADYWRRGRLWLRSDMVLASRRLAPAGFWVPAPAVEFEYYLVKCIDKASLDAKHVARLAALLQEDELGCRAALLRLMGQHGLSQTLQSALQSGDVAWFAQHRASLRRALAPAMPRESAGGRLLSRLADARQLLNRIRQPSGLVIAVLGPDGSGKTTVIEHLQRELTPGFIRVRRFHLRPHFGKRSAGRAVVTDPHGQPPRGAFTSAMKVALFTIDYWWGWLRFIWPAKHRSALVIFDRYYHDMLVDPRRYRLPKEFGIHRWFAPLVPQPDLWLVLTAPASILFSRKGEVTVESALQLCKGYSTLASELPGAAEVNSAGALQETLAQATSIVCDRLARRMSNDLVLRGL